MACCCAWVGAARSSAIPIQARGARADREKANLFVKTLSPLKVDRAAGVDIRTSVIHFGLHRRRATLARVKATGRPSCCRRRPRSRRRNRLDRRRLRRYRSPNGFAPDCRRIVGMFAHVSASPRARRRRWRCADPHAVEDDCAAADPDVVADRDGRGISRPAARFTASLWCSAQCRSDIGLTVAVPETNRCRAAECAAALKRFRQQLHGADERASPDGPARSIVNRMVREVGPISDKAPDFPLAAGALAPLRAATEPNGSRRLHLAVVRPGRAACG